MAHQSRNPAGIQPLFNESEIETLLAWDQQQGEAATAASRSLVAQRLQTSAARMAAQKVTFIRDHLNQYSIRNRPLFEAFLMRVFEMIFDIRSTITQDTRTVLEIDSESGWPNLKIKVPHPMTPVIIDSLRASTRNFLWKMAEVRAPELPQEVRVIWQLCYVGEIREVEYFWGNETWQFGRLDRPKEPQLVR
ncbi:hypothetical protein ONZ43_g3011 [Nemania bipapillata]|uniref:Uncharacterized protein n=1 Tax=Nemania bipapillata TaxID=110536 RepID=A0ACC2IZ26_9PEZI|nr:hypothetical protein ONZ43_g3011 [Nemania bipapillata]